MPRHCSRYDLYIYTAIHWPVYSFTNIAIYQKCKIFHKYYYKRALHCLKHSFLAITSPTFVQSMYFDNMNAYTAIEGFLTKSGFILKELCIFYDSEEFDHYMFEKPSWTLTGKDLETVQYASTQLNGLHLYDGSIPYKEIDGILRGIKDYQIYTFSDLAVTTLRKYLPNTKKIKNI